MIATDTTQDGLGCRRGVAATATTMSIDQALDHQE